MVSVKLNQIIKDIEDLIKKVSSCYITCPEHYETTAIREFRESIRDVFKKNLIRKKKKSVDKRQ